MVDSALPLSFPAFVLLIRFRIPAFIYTDPGSGALLWQLLLASFFGAAFYARFLTRSIRERVLSLKRAKRDGQAAESRIGSSSFPDN